MSLRRKLWPAACTQLGPDSLDAIGQDLAVVEGQHADQSSTGSHVAAAASLPAEGTGRSGAIAR